MLRPDHPALTLDLFRRLLNKRQRAVRIEAVRSLCQSPRRGRFEILAKLADDRMRSVAVRAEAIAGLADDAAAHRERLLALASGEQPVLRHEALRSLRGVSLTEGERSHASHSQAAAMQKGSSWSTSWRIGERRAAIAARSNRDLRRATSTPGLLSLRVRPTRRPASECSSIPRGRAAIAATRSKAEAAAPGRTSRRFPPASTAAAWSSRSLRPARRSHPSSSPRPWPGTMGPSSAASCSSSRRKASSSSPIRKAGRIQVKSGDIAERKPQTISIMPEDLARP